MVLFLHRLIFVSVGKTCDDSDIPTNENAGTRLTYKRHYYFEDEVSFRCETGTSVGESMTDQSVKCGADGVWRSTIDQMTELHNCTGNDYLIIYF